MVSLYEISIPIYILGLETMSHLLNQAESSGKISGDLTTHRLIDDMRGLAFQVQTLCNNVKFAAVRVGGVPDITFTDTETTYAELQERVSKVLDWLKASVKPEDFEGKDNEIIEWSFPTFSLKVPAHDYITKYSLPNFYFHLTTAYNILRSKGVEIGKKDFIAKFLAPYMPPPKAS